LLTEQGSMSTCSIISRVTEYASTSSRINFFPMSHVC
jgi:hypothetical protein